MTEAGEKWALKTAGKNWPEPGIVEQSEYWLRAFCDEVEKRAKEWCRSHTLDSTEVGYAVAFASLKRELLSP